jgi:hypothetical protein
MPQSTILGDTGNGATITFASGISAALKVRFIDPSALSVGAIDVSHLGSTGVVPTIPEDLAQAQTLQLEAIWDTFFVMPVTGLDLGNVTVTFPTRPGETTPASFVAKGHVQSVKPPRLENNVLQVLQLTIQFEETIAHTKST